MLYEGNSNINRICDDDNFNKIILGKGSCIFIHLTNNYNPTAGCIALQKKDFLIMLKLINKNTRIKIKTIKKIFLALS